MKYCKKCGTPVDDNAKFCPKCGMKFSNTSNVKTEIGRKPKKSRKLLKILIPAGLVAAGLLIFGIVMLNRPETINMNDYLTIDISGYDKYGTATVNFDETKFADDVVAAMAKKHIVDRDIARVVTDNHYTLDQIGKFSSVSSRVEDVYDSVTWRLEGAEDGSIVTKLSNGDKVTVSIAYDNEKIKPYKIHLEGKKIEKDIKDLKKVATFDAFENIELSTEGMDGEGVISYNLPDAEEHGLAYSADQTEELSNGDTVTITVYPESYDSFNSDYIDEYGEIPKETDYEVEISGLPEYLKKLSDISDSGLDSLKKEGNDQITSRVVQSYILNSINYSGACLLTAKENAENENILFLAYELNIGSNDGKTRNTYVCIEVPDVSVNSDGNVGYSIDDIYTDLGSQSYFEYFGYNTLNELTTDIITPEIGSYNKESTF